MKSNIISCLHSNVRFEKCRKNPPTIIVQLYILIFLISSKRRTVQATSQFFFLSKTVKLSPSRDRHLQHSSPVTFVWVRAFQVQSLPWTKGSSSDKSLSADRTHPVSTARSLTETPRPDSRWAEMANAYGGLSQVSSCRA